MVSFHLPFSCDAIEPTYKSTYILGSQKISLSSLPCISQGWNISVANEAVSVQLFMDQELQTVFCSI